MGPHCGVPSHARKIKTVACPPWSHVGSTVLFFCAGFLKGCPVAHHTLVSGLAHVPGVTAFDKFSAVLSAEDVLHSDVQVILGNVEKLPTVL